jgi:hypothetical protein
MTQYCRWSGSDAIRLQAHDLRTPSTSESIAEATPLTYYTPLAYGRPVVYIETPIFTRLVKEALRSNPTPAQAKQLAMQLKELK